MQGLWRGREGGRRRSSKGLGIGLVTVKDEGKGGEG